MYRTTYQGAHSMKSLFTTAVAAALTVAVIAAGAASGGVTAKTVAFTAKYAGTATTNATDNTVAINANGTGSGTLIGAGKVTGIGSGDSSQRPCVPFTGTGSMTGPGGGISFKVTPAASGCGDDSGQNFTVSGKLVVTKATGKLANYKGTLRMSGTYDRSSGAFSVKFFGTLAK